MLSRLRTIARSLFHRRRFEEGLAEEMRFHLEQYTAGPDRGGTLAGRCRAPRANRVRQRGQRHARLPRGARASRVRHAAAAPAVRRTDPPQAAGVHRHGARHARDHGRRQPGDFRDRGRRPPSSASLPRAGSPRRDLQHVPESRRPGRWRVGDELLRAPACHRRADERVALSRRRRHRRRSRRDRARVRDPRHAGVLRDAGRASRPRAHLHGRGHGVRRDLHGRPCRHRDRRVLARPPRRRSAGARPHHPNGRRAR